MDGSRAAATSSQAGGAQFPAGLRVLVVDDDPTFLKILEQKLRYCLYDVTTCQRAEIALSMLREKKDGFDLVLSDVHMPDMDGFKLLELIGLEMDLPVIMMSVDDGKDLVMKGVKHGACDYLIKPVRIEALKNIWQHVVRRKKNEFMDNDIKDLEQSGSVEENDKLRKSSDDGEYTSSANEANWKTVKKRKEDNEEDDDTEEREDSSTLKKPRVVWSVDLHQQFVAAVNQLGIDKAVPKKILELMNVPGLTRENVASHLQKFRLYLRRVSAPQHQARNDIPLAATKEAAAYGSFGSFEGVDLQALAGSCQLTPQTFAAYQTGPRRIANTGVPITDQMNFFNFDGQVLNYSKMRAPSANEWNDRQINSRDGPSAGMVPRQLGQPQQMVQSYGNMGLHVNRGTSSFSQPLPSAGVSSLVHSSTSSGHHTNTLVTQMTQQGHHFSLSQQQNNLNMDMSKQPQSTGLLLNGIAAQCDSRLSSSIKQQVLPNEISDQVYRRSGATITADSLISGTYINTSNSAMPQASYPNFQNGGMIQSVGKVYPHVSGVDSTFASSNVFQGPVPTIGSLQANSVGFKMSKDLAPSFDPLSEICQNQNQGWKLQNTNLPYDSVQHLGSKQSNINFTPSLSTHQDLVSSLKDGNSRNTHTVSKEILSVRTEIESGTVECVSQHNSTIRLENSARLKAKSMPNTSYQDMPFDDVVIPNELMNIIGEQQQEGAGQVDTDFNFDGYHLDNISV